MSKSKNKKNKQAQFSDNPNDPNFLPFNQRPGYNAVFNPTPGLPGLKQKKEPNSIYGSIVGQAQQQGQAEAEIARIQRESGLEQLLPTLASQERIAQMQNQTKGLAYQALMGNMSGGFGGGGGSAFGFGGGQPMGFMGSPQGFSMSGGPQPFGAPTPFGGGWMGGQNAGPLPSMSRTGSVYGAGGSGPYGGDQYAEPANLIAAEAQKQTTLSPNDYAGMFGRQLGQARMGANRASQALGNQYGAGGAGGASLGLSAIQSRLGSNAFSQTAQNVADAELQDRMQTAARRPGLFSQLTGIAGARTAQGNANLDRLTNMGLFA